MTQPEEEDKASRSVLVQFSWLLEKGGRLRMLKIDEVDQYQRANPYIRTGYRDKLTYLSCVWSIFKLHNETLNIWTHLLGFLVFVFLLVKDFIVVIPNSPEIVISFADYFVLVMVLLSYQACMIFSAVFHTFTCHSQKISEKCLSLDLFGITMALLATYLSGIYYAFWCQPGWRDFYLLTVGGILVVAAGMQVSPKFCGDEYAHLRVGLFTTWAVYGLIPTVHWVSLHDGFAAFSMRKGVVIAMLPRIVVMYALCGIAFVFYVGKIPERFVPSRVLDLVGHSHQWWHLFVFVALLFWHQTGIRFALFRLATTCDMDENHLSDEAERNLHMWPF